MSSELSFGYFNFFGRGQISRLLLAYTKTQFRQVSYSFSKINQWIQKDKVDLGLQFPSLPYLIDGQVKLTQSRAIQRYIIYRAKRTDLLGKNNKQRARISNIQGVLRDILNSLIQLFLCSKQYEQTRKKTYESIQSKMSYLNAYIGSSNCFFSRTTYPDFILVVVFQFFKLFYPHQYQGYLNIERVVNYINSLKQIKSYYQRPQSVSKVVAPQKQNDPKFNNLRPIKQILKQDYEQIVNSQQPVVQQKLQQVQKEIDRMFQQAVQNQITKKSTQQIKAFQARKNQFLNKVNKSNEDKQAEKINIDNEKTSIITPSKIAAQKSQQNSATPWKISSQNSHLNSEAHNMRRKSQIVLGYWGIRGLGQIQRHLLSYCQIDFTQKIYLTQQQWTNGDKNTLNLPFPNLPYLLQGDFKLTESLSINRYIIKISQKKDLLGRTLKDQMYVENTVKILSDLFKEIRQLCFTQDKDQKKSSNLGNKLASTLQRLQGLVNQKQYSLGYLTLIDFYLAEVSYYIQNIFPDIFKKYNYIERIRNTFKQLPQIQKYYLKQNSVKGPFMPPTAKISF